MPERVTDSDEVITMPFRLPPIDTGKAGFCFFFAGCLIGLTVGFASVLAGESPWVLLGFLFACGTLAVLIWMMILVSYYDELRRKRRNRLLRKALGKPSPWGERRTETADPYEDRLASFLTRSVDTAGSGPVGFDEDIPPAMDSSRRFWSLFDLPQDSVEPKPQSYIRRLLYRIRIAVRGE